MNKDALIEAVRGGRTMHALLIAGPPGSGRRALAERAAAAFCFGEPDVSRLPHCPDYAAFGPGPIGVDEVRALTAMTAAQSFSHGRRAFVLLDAHNMTPQAQNALLKTLEEPPADTLIVLTGVETGFLPTIRSRCAIFRLGAMPPEAVAAALMADGVDAADARLAAVWSDGVMGLAGRMSTEEYRTFRKKANELFEQALFSRAPFMETAQLLGVPVFPQPEGAKKTRVEAENAALLLEIFSALARDALMAAAHCGRRRCPEAKALTDRIAERFTSREIQGIIETILVAQTALSYRANPVMTLDAALVRLTDKEKKTV